MAWSLLSLTCFPQYCILRLMYIVMWRCRSFTVGEKRYKCEGGRSEITPVQWMVEMTRKIFAFPSCFCWKDLEAMIPQKHLNLDSCMPYPLKKDQGWRNNQIQSWVKKSTRWYWDRLRPGTLCCGAAMLGPGQTSPPATKYKETTRD